VDTPVFIIVRDRLRDLRRLVAWLERAGHRQIVLLDNASTWPPLLDYLSRTPHGVIEFDQNLGARALWEAGLVPQERYIVTDPDIVPTEGCPLDAIEHLHRLMDTYERPKVGLGLYLDDVEFPSKGWERQLVSREIAPGVFDSLIDTTFALYEAGSEFVYEALRTGAPYQARHMSWYSTPDTFSDEDRYYLAHADIGPTGSSWKESLHGVQQADDHS